MHNPRLSHDDDMYFDEAPALEADDEIDDAALQLTIENSLLATETASLLRRQRLEAFQREILLPSVKAPALSAYELIKRRDYNRQLPLALFLACLGSQLIHLMQLEMRDYISLCASSVVVAEKVLYTVNSLTLHLHTEYQFMLFLWRRDDLARHSREHSIGDRLFRKIRFLYLTDLRDLSPGGITTRSYTNGATEWLSCECTGSRLCRHHIERAGLRRISLQTDRITWLETLAFTNRIEDCVLQLAYRMPSPSPDETSESLLRRKKNAIERIVAAGWPLEIVDVVAEI